MTAIIEARGLTKKFGDRAAVDDLSFVVHAGRVTGFLGPNGSGKTTTLRMVLGLASPTSGSATLWGQPYAQLERPARRVGVMLDAASFHPNRTARNHLRWVAAAGEIDPRRIDSVLSTVELTDDAERGVGEFSLGMRQRLGLAVALLGDPDVLVLDEPANGLDPAGIRWLRESLRRLSREGKAVFVSSHQLAEIAQMADEVVVLRAGRLVTQTAVQELTGGTSSAIRVRTPDPDRLTQLLVTAGAEVTTDTDQVLHVRGLGAEQVGETAAANGVVLHELAGQTRSLEDVFFELTGKEGPR